MPTFRELLFGAAPATSYELASINESAYQAAWISTEDWHFECPRCRRRTPFSEKESFLFCGHCFTHCSVSGGVKEIPEEYSFLAPINATHFCGVVTVKPERLLPGMAGNILENGCICWYPAEGTAEVLLDQDHMNLATGRIRERIESSIRQRSPAITNIKWITIGVQTVAIKEDIERGAFEKWAKRQKRTLGGGLQLDRTPAGERWDYVTKAAESAWRAWQAARSGHGQRSMQIDENIEHAEPVILSRDDYVGWYMAEGTSSRGVSHVLMKGDKWSLCRMTMLAAARKNESPFGPKCKTCLKLLMSGKKSSGGR